MLRLNLDVRGLDQARRLFARGLVKRPLRRTIDRELTATRRDLVTVITHETTLTKPSANRFIKTTRRTSQEDLTGIVTISGAGIPLTEYKPQVSRATVTVAADISARAGRGIEVIRKAFNPLKHPKREIYERVKRGGKRVGRYPIRPSFGPSAARHFDQVWPRQAPITVKRLTDAFTDNLQDELDRRRGQR